MKKKLDIYIYIARYVPILVIATILLLFFNVPQKRYQSYPNATTIPVDSLLKMKNEIIDAVNKGMLKGEIVVFLTKDRMYTVDMGIKTLYNKLGGKNSCYYGGGIFTGTFIFQAKFVSSCEKIEDYGRKIILKNGNEYPVNRSNVWKVKLLLKKCNAECMPNCCPQK